VQLQSLIGQTDLSPYFDIQGSLEVPPLNLSLSDLQTAALANRPDYAAARDSVQKAKSDQQLASANGATDVTVGTEFKRNGPFNTFGLTFQVPLRVFDRNQGEKLRTTEELRASQYSEQAARLQVAADVKQAWDAYQNALTRAQLYSSNYLQMARSVRDRIQFSYQNSGTSLLDYLDAVRSYRDVQLAAHAANAQLLTAIHQLSFASATELLK
jgi:cobalt-zinc-cadmium efflux system outer membrane protein